MKLYLSIFLFSWYKIARNAWGKVKVENTKWIDSVIDESIAVKLAESCSIDYELAKLLVQRDITNEIEATKFLYPKVEHICNPFKLKDMEKAVYRLEKAIKDREKIMIYGDYDVDGITSTSLLMNGLTKLGANVSYYIPSRDAGYGVSCEALEKISEKAKVVVTVDCGITSNNEIEYAKTLGMDVIVTDHHEIQEIPNAYAVINPKRTENVYKFQGLAGVGTAFMLLLALYKAKDFDLNEAYSLLDLVAIGTVSDVVPLISENRIFVKYGLEIIKNSNNIGLQVINERLLKDKAVTSMDIGFKIAPLFNAAGRLENADKVVEFLTTKNRDRANEIFEHLDKLNKERRELGKTMLEDAIDKVDNDNKLNVIASKDFHHGLVGIIAARLVDKHNVPAIVLKIKDDNTATGSARSIEGFNLVEGFKKCEDILLKFGGHSKAAGLTIDVSKIDEFRDRIQKIFEEEIKDSSKKIKISSRIHDFAISLEFYQNVEKLKPFGYGNPEPIFVLEDISIVNARKIGKDENHLMFDLLGRKKIRNAVWFKKAEHLDKIDPRKRYDLAFRIEENFFNGKSSPKVYVEDMKKNENKKCAVKYYRDLHKISLPIKSSILSEYPIPLNLEIDDNNSQFFIENSRIQLNEELQNLLKELQNNYFYKFKLKTLSSKKREHLFVTEIEIVRSFDYNAKDEKDSLIKIKELLIGNFEYNNIQKQVLRKIIVDKEAVNLISQRGRGIKTIALAIAMYIFNKTGKKSKYISKGKIPENMRAFFDREAEGFAFIDNCEHNAKGIFLAFYDKDRDVDNKIVDSFDASKIEIVPKSNAPIYNRAMKLEHKKIVVEKIKKGEKIKAEREILALL